MPDGQQFDGQNAVAGYTLFHGKDGQSYYLKGESLSDSDIASRVATLRSQSSPATASTQTNPQSTNPGFTEMMQRIDLARKGGKVLPGESVTDALSRVDHGNALSRTLQNMTSAMAGQPMQNPEDRPAAEAGKKAGTIAGGLQIATGAVLGPLFAPAAGTAQVGTGVLDAAGNEVMKEVAQAGPSLGRQVIGPTLAWMGRHKYLSALAYEGARHAGIPLPNIIGWLAKAASEVK